MDRETMTEMMKKAISNVLDTMFFQPVQFVDSKCTLKEWFSDKQSLIGATLSFNGPSVGSFYLLLPVEVAKKVTANFLGLVEEEINKEQRRDTVKEALNIIGGHMFSLFDNKGDFKLGIPELIEGNDLTENKLGDLKWDIIHIETENNRFAAGIIID